MCVYYNTWNLWNKQRDKELIPRYDICALKITFIISTTYQDSAGLPRKASDRSRRDYQNTPWKQYSSAKIQETGNVGHVEEKRYFSWTCNDGHPGSLTSYPGGALLLDFPCFCLVIVWATSNSIEIYVCIWDQKFSLEISIWISEHIHYKTPSIIISANQRCTSVLLADLWID